VGSCLFLGAFLGVFLGIFEPFSNPLCQFDGDNQSQFIHQPHNPVIPSTLLFPVVLVSVGSYPHEIINLNHVKFALILHFSENKNKKINK